MLKILLVTILLNGIFQEAYAQRDTIGRPDWGSYKHLDIGLGINRNPSPTKSSTAFHSIELSLIKSLNHRYNHPGSSSLFLSQEIGIADKNWLHSYKLGAWIGFWGFELGSEFKLITDYKNERLSYSPFIGFGNYPLRLTIGYEFLLISSEHLNLSSFNTNITFTIFKLKPPEKRH